MLLLLLSDLLFASICGCCHIAFLTISHIFHMIFTFTPSRHSMIISRDLNDAFSRRRTEMKAKEKGG